MRFITNGLRNSSFLGQAQFVFAGLDVIISAPSEEQNGASMFCATVESYVCAR